MTRPVDSLDNRQVSIGIQEKQEPIREGYGNGGLEGIDVGYNGLKTHVEKSLLLLAEGETQSCAICAKQLEASVGTLLTCPKESCRAGMHMTCLSKRFLHEEGMPNAVVPICGSCPQCKSTLRWIDLVKEMSLRVRGEREVTRLMKRPTVRKTKVKGKASTLQTNNTGKDVDESDDQGGYGLAETTVNPRYQSEEPLPVDWHRQVDDDDDAMSTTSADFEHPNFSDAVSPPTVNLPARKLEVVIEDSDWSNAEILD